MGKLNVYADCFDRSVIPKVKLASHVLYVYHNKCEVVDTFFENPIEEGFEALAHRVDNFLGISGLGLAAVDACTRKDPGCNAAIFEVTIQNGVRYQLNFVEIC